MSRDLIGPALKLEHRVLIQKLSEQEHTALGGSREGRPDFSPAHLRGHGQAARTVSPTRFPWTPVLSFQQTALSRVSLLPELPPTASRPASPYEAAAARGQQAGKESPSGAARGAPPAGVPAAGHGAHLRVEAHGARGEAQHDAGPIGAPGGTPATNKIRDRNGS